MAKITVSIEATDALLAQGALDKRAGDAEREAIRLFNAGDFESDEYVIACTTAKALRRTSAAIVASLYPELRFRGDWDDVPVAS
jgi:hypothetical protein